MTNKNDAGSASNGQVAPSIDQVRELIFGSEQRRFESDISSLRAEMVSMEERLNRKIETLSQALERAENNQTGNHRATMEALGSAITALGQEVGALADR